MNAGKLPNWPRSSSGSGRTVQIRGLRPLMGSNPV